MHAPEILTATNGALAVAIGIFAIGKFPYNRINRTFALVAFAFALWIGSEFLPLAEELKILIALGAATLFAASNFHFTKNLIGGHNHKLALLGIYCTNLALFALLAADQLGFSAIPVSAEIWLGGFLATLALTILTLAKSFSSFSGVKKYQLKFVLLEFIIAITVISVSVVYFWDPAKSLVANIAFTPQLLTAVHLFAVFYFFVQWKFLKLKIIAPKILKRLSALLLTLTITVSLSIGTNIFELGHNAIITHISSVLTAVLLYTLTLRFFERQNWFTTLSLNNFRQVVENFKNQNIFYSSVKELETNIHKNFSQKIGVDEARVVVLDLESSKSQYPELEKYFATNSRYLVTSEEEYLTNNKHINCPYLEELQQLGDVCFPLFQNTNELIGFFAIRHANDDIYIEEELKFLEGGVHYIALSLVAILYTERLRQQSEKLREDYEKLKTLDDAKDAFIANVSHELRTPATAIRGYAEMLIAPNFGELSAQQKDFTRRIARNTDWLLRILTDILEITKIESGQIKFKFAPVNARDLLKKLAEKWQKTCEQKGLTFEFDFAPGTDTKLTTDAEKLTEVFERLLGNAHKFTDTGSVKLSAHNRGESLEIEVADTGIGIAPEKINPIWDKFSQSVNILEKGDESSGLGLAIVKKLVENLNGEITVKSALKRGSTFKLLIPRQNG
ncbi:MAG: HAMP domain-containing sensor histidine kinase [Patescibacteria group bacterium]